MIDFENVASHGLVGLNHLKKNDKIVIFYSQVVGCITMTISNALDFELVYYMRFKSGIFRGQNLEFNIITNDNGYLATNEITSLLKLDHVTINQFASINNYFEKQVTPISKNQELDKNNFNSINNILKKIITKSIYLML